MGAIKNFAMIIKPAYLRAKLLAKHVHWLSHWQFWMHFEQISMISRRASVISARDSRLSLSRSGGPVWSGADTTPPPPPTLFT